MIGGPNRGLRAIFILLAMLVLGLFILSTVDGPVFEVVISWVLVLLPAFGWYATHLLHRASTRRPDIESLRSRWRTQAVLALASTIGGILGLNRLAELALPVALILTLLAVVLVLISVPAIEWLWTWRREWAPDWLRRRMRW